MHPRIGVLALQGGFERHQDHLERLGAEVIQVRRPDALSGLDGIIIPGGESTTMSMLAESSGLLDPLDAAIRDGLAVLGTCAGMILLASAIRDGRPDQRRLGAIDIAVRRNGYGRQLQSFETDLDLAFDGEPMRAVFIRAPMVEECGPGVEVLASYEGHPVLVREGRAVAAAFHPELTDDPRVHRWFLEAVVAEPVNSSSPTVS